MNCDKIWNCEKCENEFGNGRDFCRGCGFDLNVWNEEDDDEENHCCVGCEKPECEFVDEAWICKECLEAADMGKLDRALKNRVEMICGMLKELIDPKYGGVCMNNLKCLDEILSEHLGTIAGDEFNDDDESIRNRLYKLEEKYK